ncbi:MAG TPA: tetratricopeptide repeat protein, partial [Spongiibacteraceae bacterium]|nr:tetratricopeptide repeat protein [Spongiibacteraceae bacterium]
MTHHQAGRLAEASAIYQSILQIEPSNADALHLSGLIAQQTGQLDIAVELISLAIAIKPAAPMYYNLGLVRQMRGELAAAADNYRQALALNPDDARAHGNLGAVQQLQGNLDAAISCYRKAIALNPNDAAALGNLGVALERLGDTAGAVKNYRRALTLNPNDVVTLNNLGNALREQEHLAEAVDCLQKALALKPDYAEAHNNLGNALQDQGNLDAAVASFHTALALQPNYVDAHWNEALALLMQGRLEEGWAKHDWRLRKPDHITDYRGLLEAKPLYAGENLADKTLLVWAEQGVGDEIFFAGVLPDAVRAAKHCIVECDARLVTLYARSFPRAEIIPKRYPPHERTQQFDIDWQCPIGSLPRWFRPTVESFPQHRGYLVPDPQRVAFWKQRFAELGPAPKVGIGWRSKRRSTGRDLHYTELDQWGPILAVPGLTFINLQYDECSAELDAARKKFGVEIYHWDDIDQMNDLDEVAALMSALDLVIGPTTTPQIMAGAVGVPTW